MEEMNEVLRSIHDEESAREAIPKNERIYAELDVVATQMNEISPLSHEELLSIEKKLGKRLSEADAANVSIIDRWREEDEAVYDLLMQAMSRNLQLNLDAVFDQGRKPMELSREQRSNIEQEPIQ